MDIRIMKVDDYEKAMKLWYGADGVGHSPDDTEEYIASYLARNPNTSFVAFEDDKMIGAIMAGHDGYRGFIHHTAVLENYRGRGIGTLLVNNVVDAINREGINKVVLVAFATNKRGNAFWKKQGFYVREDLLYRDRRINE